MLHGRQRECALVDQLLAGARELRSGCLVLRGEPGIGKSALLAYAADRANGMRVVRGSGVEAESELPFAAVHQLLHPVRDYLDRIPARQRDALRGAFGLGAGVGEDRFLVSVAILSLLAEVAEERPLLCLVDDAQWLDGASADALTFVARRLEAEGIALLFAARDDDPPAFPAPGLQELRLAGLDLQAAEALLAEQAPLRLATQVRDRLVAGTAGNPLGLLEVPASLSAAQLAGRELLPDRLPVGAGIEQLFLQRVRRQPEHAQTLLLVAAAEDGGHLATVLRAGQLLGVPADAVDQAERAGLVRVDATTITFRHPLVRSAVYRGATFSQRRSAQQALAAAPPGAVAVTGQVVSGLGSFLGGDTARAATLLRAGVQAAEASDEPAALVLAASAAMFIGDDTRSLALYARGAARARAEGAVTLIPQLLGPMASLEMWSGRFAAATASASEGLRLALEIGQDNAAAHHRAVLAWVAAVQGRAEECRAAAEASLPRALGQRLGPQVAIAKWALALLDLGAGRPAEAADRLQAIATAGAGEGHPVITVFSAADLVEAAARAARPGPAAAALAALDAFAGHTGAVWARALVARCRGLLAARPDADDHFEQALALHARGGRPFDTARTELRYGEALRRRRRRLDARVHLRAACEGFERLGADPWAEQARVELRATGETARKRDPSAIRQLTPQELQIVRFVGEGATNREIAAQLFLSPRTVEYHLHKVFTKLGMSSRTELVRLSVRDDLRTDHPMLQLRLFRNPRFAAANVSITLVFFAFFGTIFFLTIYLQTVLGYTALQAGSGSPRWCSAWRRRRGCPRS